MDLQKYFEKFHEEIKLNKFSENSQLREKRDMLLKELRKYLPSDCPKFQFTNQGSYAINTGVKPRGGDYDIDIGLKFNCYNDDKDWSNPTRLKVAVKDALT
ncbi:nucleotidyltransferase, partial [bacterium]|nr:nucleotidyltransferase [bacterium]